MKIGQWFFLTVLATLVMYSFLSWWFERPLVHITAAGECVRVMVRGVERTCPDTLPMFYDTTIVMSEEEIKDLQSEAIRRKQEAWSTLRRQ